MATTDELLDYCAEELDASDCERLTCWIAWRQGRNQALAGDRAPLERLRHASTHWLSSAERDLLLAWMGRRAERGQAQIPG